MRREPEWVTVEDAVFFHREIIEAFGGSPGIRDQGLLESAMARPKAVFAYESQDLAVLAGAYAHALAKNHPFVDGNKRIAFVVARVFLGLNDVSFDPAEAEAVVFVEGLAAGMVTQDQFTAWVRKNSK
ncbi:MAG: type II toxin-antitoxin system death-on-curing family toxin [Planctomycetes bacterium]|nr:type II toxin-antitoxin system death-on-curing family toxin [Planctomycetota bacterium]